MVDVAVMASPRETQALQQGPDDFNARRLICIRSQRRERLQNTGSATCSRRRIGRESARQAWQLNAPDKGGVVRIAELQSRGYLHLRPLSAAPTVTKLSRIRRHPAGSM
jgi:hypothetical protein